MLARAGHHSRILIADGNYPASTKKGPAAEVVCLNLSPGVVTVAQVLRAVVSAVPIDQVNTMGIPPTIHMPITANRPRGRNFAPSWQKQV